MYLSHQYTAVYTVSTHRFKDPSIFYLLYRNNALYKFKLGTIEFSAVLFTPGMAPFEAG